MLHFDFNHFAFRKTDTLSFVLVVVYQQKDFDPLVSKCKCEGCMLLFNDVLDTTNL